MLFKLRNLLFAKLQELPLEFFNQNKAGDLISRINNDTDKLNQFFSQALVQVTASAFAMTGAVVFMLTLHPRLGLAALAPAAAAFATTRALAGWVKRKNLANLQALGALSGGVQEGLSNFRVIAAFNRGDYFEHLFGEVNERNYRAAVAAGIANTVVIPLYGLALNLAQIIVPSGNFTVVDGISKPGGFVDLLAVDMDVLCVISNCPQINNPCNGFNPTPIRVVIWDP